MTRPVIIVGGGITGLAAAYELSTRDLPFVLLEASDRCGGLIRTEHIDDLTIESGADSMLAQKRAAIDLCDALGLGPRLISTMPPRTAFVHARGRLYPIPPASIFGIPTTPEGIDEYELLSPAARTRLKANFTLPPRPAHNDESVGDFFRRQFGDETVAAIAEPLLGGIHAGDVERLSIACVAPRLVEAEATEGSVLRAFSRRTAEGSADGAFRSLRGGMGELVKALIESLPAGSVWPSTPVTDVAPGDSRWNVTTASNTFTADAVILALPAHRAAAALSTVPELASLCAMVPYVSTASVALAWPRTQVPHPLNGTGFVVSRLKSALRITACSWVSSKWAGRAPEEVALLRVFLGSATAPEILERPDDELIRIAIEDVSAVLGIATPPAFARAHRWVGAGAQHNVGHRELVQRIDAQLDRAPGLFVAGSGFNAIGVPDCIADGRRVAALAAARRADPDRLR